MKYCLYILIMMFLVEQLPSQNFYSPEKFKEIKPTTIREMDALYGAIMMDKEFLMQNALETFNELIEEHPNYSIGYCLRGLTYYNLNNWSSALRDIEQAFYLDIDSITMMFPDIYLIRGNIKGKLNDQVGSIRDYTAHLDKFPYDPYAYQNRGVSKSELKDYLGAIQDFKTAIAYRNKSSEYTNQAISSAYLVMGNSLWELDRIYEAIDAYNNSIYYSPKFADAYINKGLILLALGEKQKGCQELSKAGELGTSEAYDMIRKYCQ